MAEEKIVKRDSSRCKQCIGLGEKAGRYRILTNRVVQVQTTENMVEIRRRTGLSNDVFQELSKILRQRKMSLEIKKVVELLCYIYPPYMTVNVGKFLYRLRRDLKRHRCGSTNEC